jgi:hypothetical protein
MFSFVVGAGQFAAGVVALYQPTTAPEVASPGPAELSPGRSLTDDLACDAAMQLSMYIPHESTTDDEGGGLGDQVLQDLVQDRQVMAVCT